MLEILPKAVTPVAPVALSIPTLVKVEKEEKDLEVSVEDQVITDVLYRVELFAEGVVGILGDMGIDTNQNSFVPLFQQLFDRCETAYHNEIWKTTNVQTQTV